MFSDNNRVDGSYLFKRKTFKRAAIGGNDVRLDGVDAEYAVTWHATASRGVYQPTSAALFSFPCGNRCKFDYTVVKDDKISHILLIGAVRVHIAALGEKTLPGELHRCVSHP
ncbi:MULTISPECIES: hypothetical protein [unclassified Rhizobium]|uniref:hypothetical protein n=1 Tax=unclassified Rhizobium TaxID=2613769 RepID=UPI001AD9B148|nr:MULTISPECIES: hypothetical protein [unclassified Rhizobium]MBO9101004.1 hypothetical protein [Rhizobium sp. L58/93]MBO9136868.1 hypothetical protein [Rhizobium sp. B209b/85]MBO9171661.1 hypothetical protein [Rhizobium sp. L245/93]MBO9186593.1 hypothetical protein [Rhizobium sp. E27B/91]QXZ86029.1 hypothetical protein J5287_23265 [Rhizobium sp. K1/93]